MFIYKQINVNVEDISFDIATLFQPMKYCILYVFTTIYH